MWVDGYYDGDGTYVDGYYEYTETWVEGYYTFEDQWVDEEWVDGECWDEDLTTTYADYTWKNNKGGSVVDGEPPDDDPDPAHLPERGTARPSAGAVGDADSRCRTHRSGAATLREDHRP